jgi:hypothetical protein
MVIIIIIQSVILLHYLLPYDVDLAQFVADAIMMFGFLIIDGKLLT